MGVLLSREDFRGGIVEYLNGDSWKEFFHDAIFQLRLLDPPVVPFSGTIIGG
jgi:hypothetical protein